jgi:FkbM family methyltransferase
MKPLEAIGRPEYLLRPSQIWRRLRKQSLCARNALRLAWGLPVRVDPVSHIGVDVINIGMHDRVVPEAICRLLDAGEHGVDVGANIGQNASIMALVSGLQGRVTAFEPSPAAWDFLTRNVESWAAFDLARIQLVRKGLSSQIGTGLLRDVGDLGGYSLEEETPFLPRIVQQGGQQFQIELTALDAFASEMGEIGLMKIDVEGHELAVLQGASRTLEQKRVRDIVFEDFNPQPSAVSDFLEAAGYRVFGLVHAWHKPMLLTLKERSKAARPGFETNFLATSEPERAISRFQSRGWKCLRIRARRKAAFGYSAAALSSRS